MNRRIKISGKRASHLKHVHALAAVQLFIHQNHQNGTPAYPEFYEYYLEDGEQMELPFIDDEAKAYKPHWNSFENANPILHPAFEPKFTLSVKNVRVHCENAISNRILAAEMVGKSQTGLRRSLGFYTTELRKEKLPEFEKLIGGMSNASELESIGNNWKVSIVVENNENFSEANKKQMSLEDFITKVDETNKVVVAASPKKQRDQTSPTSLFISTKKMWSAESKPEELLIEPSFFNPVPIEDFQSEDLPPTPSTADGMKSPPLPPPKKPILFPKPMVVPRSPRLAGSGSSFGEGPSMATLKVDKSKGSSNLFWKKVANNAMAIREAQKLRRVSKTEIPPLGPVIGKEDFEKRSSSERLEVQKEDLEVELRVKKSKEEVSSTTFSQQLSKTEVNRSSVIEVVDETVLEAFLRTKGVTSSKSSLKANPPRPERVSSLSNRNSELSSAQRFQSKTEEVLEAAFGKELQQFNQKKELKPLASSESPPPPSALDEPEALAEFHRTVADLQDFLQKEEDASIAKVQRFSELSFGTLGRAANRFNELVETEFDKESLKETTDREFEALCRTEEEVPSSINQVELDFKPYKGFVKDLRATYSK